MSIEREYEEFKGGPNLPNRDRIHVTMNERGLVYINGNCHRLLGRPEAVKLFFNRAKDRIAIKPAHARLADAFPLTAKSGYYLLKASPFCRHFGIRLSATEKFVNPEIDNEGILHLDLSTTVNVSGVRRKRKSKSS